MPGLAKYLREFGWEPIVLTMPLPLGTTLSYRVVEAPFQNWLASTVQAFGFKSSCSIKTQLAQKIGMENLSKSVDWLSKPVGDILTYPDEVKGWAGAATQAASKLIEDETFDAVLSTSPPVSNHIIAARIKKRFGLPWLADFPHLWSQNNGYCQGNFRQRFDSWREKKTLKIADALITLNAPLATKLATLHQQDVYKISHGFDPQTVNQPPAPLTLSFSITHTGSWHPVFREPSLMLSGLSSLIEKGKLNKSDLDVRFYGDKQPWLDEQIARF